ncbi:hypothetical protein E2C01_081163 [Portunus trituberculatus]|uniref:Uncharacterized protein n=1 Tax=Portunus trituberculatus TaxID=210409 RepID=A0A5B7IP35_PORTR|nr:hypothetical protein [Portunus trituberculatus]
MTRLPFRSPICQSSEKTAHISNPEPRLDSSETPGESTLYQVTERKMRYCLHAGEAQAGTVKNP